MGWTEEHPGAGNMSEITTFAARLRNRVAAIDRVGNAVAGARTEADASVFGGAAGEAWRGSVDPVLTSLASVMGHLSAMESAAETYRSGVDAIARSDVDLNRTLASKRATRNALVAHGEGVVGVEARIDNLNESIAGLRLSLHALAYQRKGLDDAFSAALQPPAGSDDARFGAMLSTYGAGAFTGNLVNFFALRDQKVDEYTQLAGKIASGDASQADIARLEAFLANTATDPALASAFWLSVGGEGTVRLFDGIGTAGYNLGYDDASMLAAAVAARESMSAGTALWSDTDAALFVASFLAVTGPGVGADTIGFLFNDRAGSPMGAPFATAMATGIDLIERDPDSMWAPLVSGNYDATSMGRLTALDCRQRDVEWYDALDPMSQVLSTLALYPADALAWLLDPTPDPFSPDLTTGAARIEYLYGEREWGYDDGLAPADLWKGSLEAPGGVRDFGPADSQPRIDQAIVSTQVMNALAQDGSPFMAGRFGDDALGSLGQAIGYELPSLVEGTVLFEPDTVTRQSGARDGYISVNPTGIDGYRFAQPMAVPYVDDDVLGKVWGQIAQPGQGQVALDDVVISYEKQLYYLASAVGENPPMTWAGALRHVAAVEGMAAGSLGGVNEYHAAIHDATANNVIDGAGFVVGILPIPGSEKIPALVAYMGKEGADMLVDTATDSVLEGGSQFAAGFFGGATESAQANSDDGLSRGKDVLEARLNGLYADPPANFANEVSKVDRITFQGHVLDEYESKYSIAERSVLHPESD